MRETVCSGVFCHAFFKPAVQGKQKSPTTTAYAVVKGSSVSGVLLKKSKIQRIPRTLCSAFHTEDAFRSVFA